MWCERLRDSISKHEEFILSRKRLRVFFSIAMSTIAGLFMGYNIGNVAPTLQPLQTFFNVPEEYNGFVIGSMIVGGFLGSLSAGISSRLIGVKLSLLVLVVLGLVSVGMTLAATNYLLFFIARGIHGFSIGIAISVCPTFTLELAPPEIRGLLGSTFNIALQTGTLFGSVLGFICTLEVVPLWLSWRLVYGLSTLFILLFVVMIVVMPESPRWRGKVIIDEYSISINAPEELCESVTPQPQPVPIDDTDSIHGEEGDSSTEHQHQQSQQGHYHHHHQPSTTTTIDHHMLPDPSPAFMAPVSEDQTADDFDSLLHSPSNSQVPRLPEIRASPLEHVKKTFGLIRRMLCVKTNAKSLLIGLCMCTLQQCTGINAILYFAPPLFAKTGLTGLTLRAVSTICVGFWNLITTLLPMLFVDWFGRRPLLLGGLVVLCFTNVLLGVNFLFVPAGVQGFVTMGLVALFLLTFNVGIGSLFWLLANEIWIDDQLKQVGPSILMAGMWGLSFFTGFSFLPVTQLIGPGINFFLFAVICAIGTSILFFLLPETKAKRKEHDLHHRQPAHTTFDA